MGRCDYRRKIQEMLPWWLECGRRRPQGKKCGWPLESQKAKEMNSFLTLPEEAQSC
jgi:hypothetical protein